MRRILFTIAFMAVCTVTMLAQLNIEQIFDGACTSDPNVTEAIVTGKSAQIINSKLDRLAFFKADAATYGEKIRKLVLADSHKASGRDLRYSDGVLSYAYIVLSNQQPDKKDNVNTFIYFVESKRKSHPATVMVVLLEGALSSKDQAKIIESLKQNKR